MFCKCLRVLTLRSTNLKELTVSLLIDKERLKQSDQAVTLAAGKVKLSKQELIENPSVLISQCFSQQNSRNERWTKMDKDWVKRCAVYSTLNLFSVAKALDNSFLKWLLETLNLKQKSKLDQ